jgi:Transposase DDE domain
MPKEMALVSVIFRSIGRQKKATCPEGKVRSSWISRRDNRGNDVINVVFAKADCRQRRSLSRCAKAKSKRRTINIEPQELHEALQQARKREKTEVSLRQYSIDRKPDAQPRCRKLTLIVEYATKSISIFSGMPC